MRKDMLGNVPKNEAKAVKAFVSSNSENALKTKPKVSEALCNSTLGCEGCQVGMAVIDTICASSRT